MRVIYDNAQNSGSAQKVGRKRESPVNAGPSHAHYALRLAVLAVKAAKQPYQNDDRDRNTEEP